MLVEGIITLAVTLLVFLFLIALSATYVGFKEWLEERESDG